jgi:hypothetical protein
MATDIPHLGFKSCNYQVNSGDVVFRNLKQYETFLSVIKACQTAPADLSDTGGTSALLCGRCLILYEDCNNFGIITGPE